MKFSAAPKRRCQFVASAVVSVALSVGLMGVAGDAHNPDTVAGAAAGNARVTTVAPSVPAGGAGTSVPVSSQTVQTAPELRLAATRVSVKKAAARKAAKKAAARKALAKKRAAARKAAARKAAAKRAAALQAAEHAKAVAAKRAAEKKAAEAAAYAASMAPVSITMVHANIFTGMTTANFQQDLAKVMAKQPDFVTLNEVSRRTDAQITPAGYASYRSMATTWTKETPVLWRTDRWERVDAGSRELTTSTVKWGTRAVNWVTLRNKKTGKMVSVISAHPAPLREGLETHLHDFMDALGVVVDELETRGPVFVGGDFNVGYKSRARWPQAQLSDAGLAATYDVLGRPAGGTGDHHGATIDYVFYQPGAGVTPLSGGTIELISDHDAVWTDLVYKPRR